MQDKNTKNYAFIDSQNLYLAVKEQGWYLDFKKFRIYLKEKYNTSKAFLFIGYLYYNQHLYKSLQEAGYILIFKPVLTKKDGKVKGNVDADLVLHTMIQYENYNQAIIITGDGDLYCLVKHLINQNKLLKLMIPDKENFSSLFRKLMPHIVFLNNLKDKIEYKKSHKD